VSKRLELIEFWSLCSCEIHKRANPATSVFRLARRLRIPPVNAIGCLGQTGFGTARSPRCDTASLATPLATTSYLPGMIDACHRVRDAFRELRIAGLQRKALRR
jgi:hypothetical protein